MGGSNLMHAHSNDLICMHFIIYTVYYKQFTTPTLTDNSSIIIDVTATAVNGDAVRATE